MSILVAVRTSSWRFVTDVPRRESARSYVVVLPSPGTGIALV